MFLMYIHCFRFGLEHDRFAIALVTSLCLPITMTPARFSFASEGFSIGTYQAVCVRVTLCHERITFFN